MNAPETIKPATDPINIAHEVLLKADEALCIEEVACAIFGGGNKPKKSDLKDAGRMLKQLANLGLIEMEPRAGGVPFYRLIAAPAAESAESVAEKTAESGPSNINEVRDVSLIDEGKTAAAGDSEGGETDAPAAINDTHKFGHGLSCGACHDGCAGEQCKVERDSPPIDAQRDEFTLLGLIADIRAAAGDPTGKLMQDELVRHIAAVVKERDDLRERMEGIAEQLRAGTIPELENVTGAEDLAPHVKTLCDSLGAAEIVATGRGHTIDGLRLDVEDLRDRLDAQIKQWQTDTGRLAADLRAAMEARSHAINEAYRLRTELTIERQARKALQEQGNATDVTAAAVGYLVRVPKRPPMIRRKPEAARLAAMGAVRAGAARAEVLAVVPVGAARRGAEWQSTEAQK